MAQYIRLAGYPWLAEIASWVDSARHPAGSSLQVGLDLDTGLANPMTAAGEGCIELKVAQMRLCRHVCAEGEALGAPPPLLVPTNNVLVCARTLAALGGATITTFFPAQIFNRSYSILKDIPRWLHSGQLSYACYITLTIHHSFIQVEVVLSNVLRPTAGQS